MLRKTLNIGILCVMATVLIAQLGLAEVILPVRYDMLNGGTSSIHYWDESYDGSGNKTIDYSALSVGKGQLTDGVLGVTDNTYNLGNGKGYEWVAWLNKPLSLVFDFGKQIDFTSVAMYGNNKNSAIRLFTSTTVSFSNDGISFNNPVVYNTPTGLSQTAQWVTASISDHQAQFVKVDLVATNNTWTFLSDVQFSGAAAASPVPRTYFHSDANSWACRFRDSAAAQTVSKTNSAT